MLAVPVIVCLTFVLITSVENTNRLSPINGGLDSGNVVLVINCYFQKQNMIRVFGAHQADFLQHLAKLDKTFTVITGTNRSLARLDDTGEYINNPSTAIGYMIVDPNWELMQFYARINPNGRWLFLLTESVEESMIWRKLTNAWQQNYMLNNLVITFSSSSTKVFFYNPFLDNEAGLIEMNIDRSNNSQQLEQLDQSLKHRFTNLHHHHLNISILRPNTEFTRPLATADSPYKNFTAIDATNGAFLDYILRFLNATPREQPNGRYLNNGNVLANGSLTGILKLIDERMVELSVNNRLVTNLGKCNVAYLRAINRSPLVYILVKRHPVPIDVLFSVFHRNAVIYQIVFFVLTFFTWWAVEISTIGAKRRSYVKVILDLVSTLFNIGITEIHSRLAFRIVFSMVLLYAFMVNNVYQGQVVSKLNNPRNTYDPQTLEQLLALDIPMYSYLRSNDLYPLNNSTGRSHSQLERIANRNIFNDNFTFNAKLQLDLVNRRKDVAMLMKIGSANGVQAGNYDPDTNEDIVHIVPEAYTSFFTAYTVRRDSPFLLTFNELILRAIETGFVIYGDRALELNNYLGHLKRYKQPKPPLEVNKISLQNVWPLFQLWLAAMGAASVAFGVELLLRKSQLHYRHRPFSQ